LDGLCEVAVSHGKSRITARQRRQPDVCAVDSVSSGSCLQVEIIESVDEGPETDLIDLSSQSALHFCVTFP
jgi:hypothetical protein